MTKNIFLQIKFNIIINILIKNCSNSTNIENIEYYFSLINNIQYFNAFILNYKKKDIFLFFKSFVSEEWGITNKLYAFFIICEEILPKKEIKNFINDLGVQKKDEYKKKLDYFGKQELFPWKIITQLN